MNDPRVRTVAKPGQPTSTRLAHERAARPSTRACDRRGHNPPAARGLAARGRAWAAITAFVLGSLPLMAAAQAAPREPHAEAALDAFSRPAPPPATLTEPPSDPLLAFPPAPPPPPLQPLESPIGLARLRPFTPPIPPLAAARHKAPAAVRNEVPRAGVTARPARERPGSAPAPTAAGDSSAQPSAEPVPATHGEDVATSPAGISATREDPRTEPHDAAPTTPAQPSPFADPDGPMHANLGAALASGESLDASAGGTNPLGFGVGVRGEYRPRVDLGWVVGARLLYFFGSSTTLPTGAFSTHSWLFAADAGHAFDLRPLWLEPLLSIGMQVRDATGRPATAAWNGHGYVVGSRSDTEVGFYLAPGLRATLPLAALSDALEDLYIGADAQLGLVFAGSVASQVELLIHAGMRL